MVDMLRPLIAAGALSFASIIAVAIHQGGLFGNTGPAQCDALSSRLLEIFHCVLFAIAILLAHTGSHWRAVAVSVLPALGFLSKLVLSKKNR